MRKLRLIPQQSSYSVEDGTDVIRTELDGGAGRYRRDVVGSASRATVAWNLTQAEYAYMRAFYRTATQYGSEPFLMDMVLNSPDLTEHKAFFFPGSLKLNSIKGLTYSVSAEVEVVPNVEDTDFDTSLLDLFDAYDGSYVPTLNQLEQFTNIDILAVNNV